MVDIVAATDVAETCTSTLTSRWKPKGGHRKRQETHQYGQQTLASDECWKNVVDGCLLCKGTRDPLCVFAESLGCSHVFSSLVFLGGLVGGSYVVVVALLRFFVEFCLVFL